MFNAQCSMFNVLNCNLYFAIIGFLPPIFILFTFQFSLFTLFLSDLCCKYRNYFVTLHPKIKKSSFFELKKLVIIGITHLNN